MGESSRMSKKMKVDKADEVMIKKIKGTVVLTKKKCLVELQDVKAATVDWRDELIGRKVYLQLVSAHAPEPDVKERRGKLGKPAHLENWCHKSLTFSVTFDWDEEFGLPGAFTIRNSHHNEFYLKTLTLEDVPNHGRVHFICNSWVYHYEHYQKDRVFFTNQTYLPSHTPELLCYYREEELEILRGNGTGKLEEWDRVYDYDVYNDLADPDDSKLIRPTLGGSTDHPYPRRGRTGRAPTKTDPTIETRLPLLDSLKIYVPRDERFSEVKLADVVAHGLKLMTQSLIPGFGALRDKLSDKIVTAVECVLKHKFESISDKKFNEFQSFDEVLKLFEHGIKLPRSSLLEGIRQKLPLELLRELFRSDGEGLLKFPKPHVLKEDTSAWRTDEEFAREMLAGLNPVVIRRVQKFPPTSKLDPELYGNQNSTITEEHIKDHLEGLDVNKAIENNRLYIVDYHDALMPYLRGINQTSTRTYATRTILFLQKDGTLKPLAIELSLPHEESDLGGAISRVCTPAEHGAEGTIWQLAKAYVAVNDSGYHQLICHWLHTHASIEPFIIATNRQLSVLHPINKLLHPHFRDTMNINAVARQTLINANGLLENTVFPDKYSMEMSSTMYKEWVFPDEALPKDLIKRGVAVEDSNTPHGIRLLIEDYPYAADGLEIWSTIKTWVNEYCSVYYETDQMVQNDCELQSWWEEVRTKGHGDKKDELWWPKMQTREELIESCTTIIWVASALHAAVNFGQYPYGGCLLNRPALSRRFIPDTDIDSDDYKELGTDPEKAFLKTITPQLQSILGISLIEILSRHSADEVFLGQRDTPEWTKDEGAIKAFENFGKNLVKVEEKLTEMNKDEKLKNRTGPAKMPYTLLYPSSETGLTCRGIPNSITI